MEQINAQLFEVGVVFLVLQQDRHDIVAAAQRAVAVYKISKQFLGLAARKRRGDAVKIDLKVGQRRPCAAVLTAFPTK
jgi:glycogen synthase